MSYCKYVAGLEPNNVHVHYHDHEYGFPIENDNDLFARLMLEVNQAGLNWTTILKKKDNFFKAYSNFDIHTVANYSEKDRERLLADAGIIRNKLKVNAAIHNAQQILTLQQDFGSFKNWLDHHHPKKKDDWVKLFKNTFKFTGGEITKEFLLSTGYLEGAHEESCEIYQRIFKLKPKWAQSK